MKTGRLSWRVRESLEQGLQSAAARRRERNDALEGRIEGWEGKLRSGLEDVRTAVAGEVKALREEQAKAMRHVERRLVRLEAGRSAQDGMERTSPTGAEPEPSKRRYVPSRTYPQLVALEAEPDEDLVYGDASPVMVDWRRARAEFFKTLKAGTVLDRTKVQERMLEMETAIVEEHELTPPPSVLDAWCSSMLSRSRTVSLPRMKIFRPSTRRWARARAFRLYEGSIRLGT